MGNTKSRTAESLKFKSQQQEELYAVEAKQLEKEIETAIQFGKNPFILYKAFHIPSDNESIVNLYEMFLKKGFEISIVGLPIKAEFKCTLDWMSHDPFYWHYNYTGQHEKTQILWKRIDKLEVPPDYKTQLKL